MGTALRGLACVMAVAAPILSPSTSGLAQDNEPTEAQMRAAVEQWFGDLHAQYREMAQACVGPVGGRTLPPDICAKICGSPSNCLSPFEVRNFSKGACRLPAQDGRVSCTFSAEIVTANPAAKAAGAPGQGLFQRSGEGWRFDRTPPQ